MTMRNGIPTRGLNPTALCRDRGTEQDDDDTQKFAVNDCGDLPKFPGADGWHLPSLQRPAPGEKFERQDDRQQTDDDEDRKFRQEGMALEIIARPLFKKEY